MDQSDKLRLLQSYWYSPRRLHDSPTRYDFPGDRFLPNRSLMDLDRAHTLLTNKTTDFKSSKCNEVYQQKLIESQSLNSEGKRIMVFRGSSKSSTKSIRFVDELRQQMAAISDNKSKQAAYRSIPKIRSLQGHSGRIASTAWNGHILTSGSRDKSIINHDIRARNHLASCIKKHSDEVCGLKWSNEGDRLASGGSEKQLYIWEASKMSSSKFLHRFTDHCAAVKALAWCPYQHNVLASGGGWNDRCIRIWNTQKGICIHSIETKAQIPGLEWNRHHREILSSHGYSTGEDQNKLCLWKYPSMTKVGEFGNHEPRIINLCQSPDGVTVVSAVADETLRFWDVFGPPTTGTSMASDLQGLFSSRNSLIR
ncbi:cell division cycle 20.2, cofactor of APC complex isoform X3 [Gossypium hirsutum]|uniref:Cell division cycle 20.2, cofactor of APC complex isoform X3 n=1 Tax=Gossypium hirsutum TaxID=3635 RepID=A0ABM3AE52_GOSHI|nr:cell division cycle 20.2, cofactor of APC complex-like isoform X3 [Gossypium hirsutum]